MRLIHHVDRLTRLAAVLLMLALLASVIAGVVSRQIGRPVPWSDEMAQYLLVWTGLVGWIIAARRNSHIRITMVIDLLPRGIRLLVEIIIQIAVIGFAAAMIWWGWGLVRRNWDIEWVSLPLSAALLYLPALFAAVALIGQAIADILLVVSGKLRQEQPVGVQPL